MSWARITDDLQRTVLVVILLIGSKCAPSEPKEITMGERLSLGISNRQPSSLVVLPEEQVGVFLESDPFATTIKPNVPKAFQVVTLGDLRVTEVPVVIN